MNSRIPGAVATVEQVPTPVVPRPQQTQSAPVRRSGTRGRIVVAVVLALLSLGTVTVITSELHYLLFDRRDLPDVEPFVRFEFPTVGYVLDADGRPLAELAREFRDVTVYADLPPILQSAILAVEDKRFFSHSGVDYRSLARVAGKARVGRLVARVIPGGWGDAARDGGLFPQGGSSITQQLVRGVFLSRMTARENSHELRPTGLAARMAASVLGARSVNMLVRKREEVRLSLWLEKEMRTRFGSKRRAKEEILARYVSFVYMGHGQFGFARAAEFYFGRRLPTLTAADAGKAAVLAGIPKAPRDYAPDAANRQAVLRRRNETLALMHANGAISAEVAAQARQRPVETVRGGGTGFRAAAVVEHVVSELSTRYPALALEDLLQGRIQVRATVDARIQRLAAEALEQGIAQYEHRHPSARGVIQGSVVALHNRDGRILAEVGGRRVYQRRSAAYTDFNRVTRSLRQPGSTMKPLVYLAAFRHGGFTLDTVVPDLPISVSDGVGRPRKWIANYDGRFKGPIPIRQALAESRNAAAMWISGEIGIDQVIQTSRSLGVRTPLARYPTTALGASEMNLLELANAYRAMASGLAAEPFIIDAVSRPPGEVVEPSTARALPEPIETAALLLVQEGLRGVVRLPTGTAHTLDSTGFGIAVMGKTGTTNAFRDAVFVGSTYGPNGITVAVRIGFDDNRSLGSRETGGRLALPVFQDVLRRVYQARLVGITPVFPEDMEARITAAMRASTGPGLIGPGLLAVSAPGVEPE